MDQNDIHYGVVIDCLQHCVVPCAQQLEKLRDEPLGIGVVVYCGVVILVEDEVEGGVVDEFL